MKCTYMEIATASGKRGGVVGGTWKGINYLRKRVVPANPRTADQMATRGMLANAVAYTKTMLTSPTVYADWTAWAADHPFRSKNGMGSQILPVYQAALTVTLNRYLSNSVDPPSSNLPTISSPVADPNTWIAEGSATPGLLALTYPGSLPGFPTPTGIYLWTQITQVGKIPDFRKSRKTYQESYNTPGWTAHDVVGPPTFTSGDIVNVWATIFAVGAAQPSPPVYIGQATIA